MKSEITNIAVFGLGKLGCPMAAVFAEAGFQVMGFDVSEPLVKELQSGRCPHSEPGLGEMLRRYEDRVRYTCDAFEAMGEAQASFVIVPTPSGDDGAFSNLCVIETVQKIGAVLRADKRREHLVAITSTVMPGSTMGAIKDGLETASGRFVGDGLGLCYSPEFIALGSVVRDMQHPDMLLIGQSDEKAGFALESILRRSVKNDPKVCRMSPVNAEVAKLSVNCFVTMKISFANMLGELCEALPGGDVDEVTKALGADSRIGDRYLKAGLGYGGPCFPRDNAALMAAGSQLGVSYDLPQATVATNDGQVARSVRLISGSLDAGSTVGIVGLSYKPNTPVIEESHAILLATELLRLGYEILAYDPLVFEQARGLDPEIKPSPTFVHCAANSDALVLADPSMVSAEAVYAGVNASPRLRHVVDCWRCLEEAGIAPGKTFLPLGGKRLSSAFPADAIDGTSVISPAAVASQNR